MALASQLFSYIASRKDKEEIREGEPAATITLRRLRLAFRRASSDRPAELAA